MITLNKNLTTNAANDLKSATFKVWVYLNQFESKSFAINRSNIMKNAGISKNTCTSVIRELKKKGYLFEDKKDVFTFYANPKK